MRPRVLRPRTAPLMLGRVALTVGSRFALTALSLVSSVITARVLGEAGRGDYFFIVTLSATIVQFTNFGLPMSSMYYVAADADAAPGLVANAFWLSLLGAGGAGVALAVTAHALGALQDTPVSYLLLAAALAPPSLFFMIVANVLAGMERFVEFNVIEAGSRALAVVSIVTAGIVGAGVAGFVGAAIAAWTASAAVTGWAALRGSHVRLRFDRPLFMLGLRYSTKVYVVTLLAFLVLRANIFLLRRDFGPNELGLYSIAAQLSDVLAIVPQAISLVIFPRLVREASTRWGATVRASLMTAGLMVVACGFTAVVAEPTIRILYGAEFLPAAAVLRIMLPGIACLGIASVLSQYLGAEGMPRIMVGIWFGAALLVGVLSLALVPKHAGAGAAAALSITYAVLLAALVVASVRHHRARPGLESLGSPIQLDLEEVPPAGE
jgi:enterobacterial common antigen flippase